MNKSKQCLAHMHIHFHGEITGMIALVMNALLSLDAATALLCMCLGGGLCGCISCLHAWGVTL